MFSHHTNLNEPLTCLNSPPAKVCLKMVGGIGDCIIALGGAAKALSQQGYEVTVSCREFQKPLITHMSGVHSYVSPSTLNDPSARSKFDALIDFAKVFNSRRALKSGGYYRLASERLQTSFGPGEFTFPRKEIYKKVVALHAGASNFNRCWPIDKWTRLAEILVGNGYTVAWLGTKDDFGFNASRVFKLSDVTDDLTLQAQSLAGYHYFIGNDSGFAHIAGVLGIPGRVIFSVIHPDDVISFYPSLSGAHCFSEDNQPSLSLYPDDDRAEANMKEISVEDVLEGTPFSADVCTPLDRTAGKKLRLGVCDVSQEVVNYLQEYFEIVSEEYDLLLKKEETCYFIHSEKGKAQVLGSNPESIRTAIREISSTINT